MQSLPYAIKTRSERNKTGIKTWRRVPRWKDSIGILTLLLKFYFKNRYPVLIPLRLRNGIRALLFLQTGCLPCCIKCFFLNGRADFLSFHLRFSKHLDQGSLTDVQILEPNATWTEILGKGYCKHSLDCEREEDFLCPLASPTTYKLSLSLFGKELGKRSLVPPSPFHPPRKVCLTWLQVSGEVLRTLGCVLQAEWRSWYEEKPQIPFPSERGGTAPDGGCLVKKPGCHWNDITMEWFYRECNCIIKS